MSRYFEDKVKRAAVARLDRGEALAEVAEDVGASINSLRAWRKQLNGDGKAAKKSRRARGEAAVPSTTRDAIVYLRHATADVHRRLRAGKLKRMDRAHLYATLALDALEGGEI